MLTLDLSVTNLNNKKFDNLIKKIQCHNNLKYLTLEINGNNISEESKKIIKMFKNKNNFYIRGLKKVKTLKQA